MSEVTRYTFDMAACWYEHPDGEFVEHDAYAKLEAAAQALREERDSQQRVAINAMEELAALRARVVVAPERKLLNAGVPGLNRNSGWNACLDELARLNGKTVSEGLLRLALEFIMATNCQGSIPLGLIEELRALLNQDKENGDHAA
ncbi:TPA: hypothetical protein NI644_004644 [Pseudomonas aeruginosa]|uniref:hypothetical protein n=1 Tax=Pseudomonas aeruginosa TaxID=287 RepID=UPI000D0350FB|nr:hypothetical protein [Pseudomonas aeruginosa]MBI7359780.1 hypothetical protein [Pseudomonas aeruginosa]MDJ1309746.1 hypothetical protein [Pseudomonas aeruginosa]PRW29006.1 hypothetical protein CSB96_4644 [Pseudomonas aeruginosa]HCF9267214.1 hypothetical protein [Pseudomonas aeruginosa]HCF9273358.1 hypothetical protein [Pseudomonas aeruginosa]